MFCAFIMRKCRKIAVYGCLLSGSFAPVKPVFTMIPCNSRSAWLVAESFARAACRPCRHGARGQKIRLPAGRIRNMWNNAKSVVDRNAELFYLRCFTAHAGAYAGVAQLVRAPACHAGGREFKSRHSRHFPQICGKWRFRIEIFLYSSRSAAA